MKVIKTELEYKKALTRLLEIFDATPNTPEGEEFELLSVLVEHYENEHNAISEPDPIAYLEYIMEKKGLKKADLVKTRRNGQQIIYSLNTSVFEDVTTLLLDLFNAGENAQDLDGEKDEI